MKKCKSAVFCLVLATGFFNSLNAQTPEKVKPSLVGWDGMMVVGYVDNGAYVNFGGPSVRIVKKPFTIGFGILPTMRIKEDDVPKGSPKNSAIMPTAGFGFTFVFKKLALQVPVYYNAKTSTKSGRWNPGIGLGFKL